MSASTSATLVYSGVIQTYTVTISGNYDISAFGGQGGAGFAGYSSGGVGAEASGVVALTAGTVLDILVGGEGGGGDGQDGGGGGGGSFVAENTGSMEIALVVGGGGGGGLAFGAGSPGTTTSDGHDGNGGAYGGFNESGGGGGFYHDGQTGGAYAGGSSFVAGGEGGNQGGEAGGGFGGGGSGGNAGGGGGGGFSGGGGGGREFYNEGGGSYVTASALQSSFSVGQTGNGEVLIELLCFLAGTAIATPSGEVAVERLRPGDLVLTEAGRAVPLVWIGRRALDASSPLDRELHYPVRVCRDAVAPGVPARDLLVTGDHALWIDGRLIPARLLVNGVSIVAEPAMTDFTYYHLELDRHDLLLAEGLACESYLDTGNRHMFAPDTIAPATRGDAVAAYAARGVAPLALAAALVEPVWRRLAARAGVAAPAGGGAPGAGAVHLLACGERLRPISAAGERLLFALPAGTDEVVIASDTMRPSDRRPWLDDRRRLGVQVRRVRLLADGAQDIALDGPQLLAGWHAVERAGGGLARWTAGVGRLRLAAAAAPGMIELTLAV